AHRAAKCFLVTGQKMYARAYAMLEKMINKGSAPVVANADRVNEWANFREVNVWRDKPIQAAERVVVYLTDSTAVAAELIESAQLGQPNGSIDVGHMRAIAYIRYIIIPGTPVAVALGCVFVDPKQP